jgi:HAD superfamily hydrolase (TIGR01549 family)
MTKALIFDMGDVLCSGSSPKSRQAWEKRLHLPDGEIGRIVFHHPLAPGLVLGTGHPDELFEAVGKDLELNESEWRQLEEDFWGEPDWNCDLFDYIYSLKSRYKLGVLSDAWITTREKVIERINSDVFDVIIFSAESGIGKPDPASYQAVLKRMGVIAAEAVFVDDRLKNAEGARNIGMPALQYAWGMGIQREIEQVTGEF